MQNRMSESQLVRCTPRFESRVSGRWKALLPALTALHIAGCSSDNPQTPLTLCTGERPSIAVSIRDAQTGRFTAGGATVVASIGTSYVDSVRVPTTDADSVPAVVGDRPGTFDLTVRKQGYADWRQTGVIVQANLPPCDGEPITAKVEAALTKSP